MNCCDYDCNQGRDCPAKVANCKPVMLAAEPLPPPKWRLGLRVWTWWMLAAAVAVPYIPVVIYFALRE